MLALLYAGDVVLLARTFQKAQLQLDALDNWCKKWRMNTNPSKSQALHIGNPQHPSCKENLKCGVHDILFVENYKYLGVFFNDFLSPKPTVEDWYSDCHYATDVIPNGLVQRLICMVFNVDCRRRSITF